MRPLQHPPHYPLGVVGEFAIWALPMATRVMGAYHDPQERQKQKHRQGVTRAHASPHRTTKARGVSRGVSAPMTHHAKPGAVRSRTIPSTSRARSQNSHGHPLPVHAARGSSFASNGSRSNALASLLTARASRP